MKKNIAVIGGGDSSEYVISVQSAQQIADIIDKSKYNVYPISIRGLNWQLVGDEFNNENICKEDFSVTIKGTKIVFDCVYITIHGTPGEDGILPAYFELLGIPHSTCDVMTSSLTFDKHFCKAYLRQMGIRAANEILIKPEDTINPDAIVENLGLPVFVKPTNGGSSFGVTKVNKKEDLVPAISKAFKEDDNDVLVEEFIEGKEITCGAVSTKDKQFAFPLTEIVTHNDFFDYEAKYQGQSDEITPARISDDLTKKCQKLTVTINTTLKCHGITRTDYILKDNEFYFIEINTIPGMSTASIVPQQVESMNLDIKDVFTWVIEDAIARKLRRQE